MKDGDGSDVDAEDAKLSGMISCGSAVELRQAGILLRGEQDRIHFEDPRNTFVLNYFNPIPRRQYSFFPSAFSQRGCIAIPPSGIIIFPFSNMWSACRWSLLTSLACAAMGTRAAVQADPEMKSIPVRLLPENLSRVVNANAAAATHTQPSTCKTPLISSKLQHLRATLDLTLLGLPRDLRRMPC